MRRYWSSKSERKGANPLSVRVCCRRPALSGRCTSAAHQQRAWLHTSAIADAPAVCVAALLQDPLAIIGLTAIFLPFVLLLVAIATGLVDVSVYR